MEINNTANQFFYVRKKRLFGSIYIFQKYNTRRLFRALDKPFWYTRRHLVSALGRLASAPLVANMPYMSLRSQVLVRPNPC